MATVNIRRDEKDPFYRYKMELLQSKIEGKGNGIKTVIVNLTSVAQSLSRPPAYVIKYFGFELGAQTNTNPSDDRWIINGAHEASKLQDYLDGFISKFVLCKKCKNPETDLVVKDGRILRDCKACGQRSDVELTNKLSSFILKNQPKKGKKDKSTKKTRRERQKEAAANGNAENGSDNGSPGDSQDDNGDDNGELELDAGSDDELTRRINAEAKEIEVEKDVKDDEWKIDMSEEAVRARAQELPDDLKQKLAFDDEDDEEGGNNAYGQLGSWIVDSAKDSENGVSGVEDVAIYMKAKELGIESKHKTLAVLAQAMFDESIVAQIPKRAAMLQKMITSERHQKAFLGGTERFLGKEHPELIPQVPKILLGYYQEDLITEEVVKPWGSKASKKYVDLSTSRKVRKAAEPFLKWLETADSDDDSEEEESDEE